MNFRNYCPYLVYLFLNLITHLIIRQTGYDFSFRFSFSSTYYNILTLLSISSMLLLIKTKQDPGELEINSKGILERQIALTDSSIKLKFTPLMIMELMPCNGCKYCKISELPLRCVHCNKCQRCIKTYDHHCYLIGSCLGENNHFVFVLFLFSQNNTFILAIFGLFQRLYKSGTFMKILIFGYLLTFGFIVIIFAIYFVFHTYLILTNQTVYEIFHRDQCPYIKIFKEERMKIYLQRGIEIQSNHSFHPFDSGIRRNIGYAFYKLFHPLENMRWEEIYFENLKSNNVEYDFCDEQLLSSI